MDHSAGPVLEVADIAVRPGDEEAFLAAFREARHLVRTTPGCRSMRMTRGVENPSRFVLLVEWDALSDHLENFRNSDRFGQWRAAIGPYFARDPHVEHAVDVS